MGGVRVLKRLYQGVAVLLVLLAFVVCPGCYHMRLDPASVESVSFVVPAPRPRLLANIRLYLEGYGMKVEESDEGRGYLLTSSSFFYKERGINQPAGGRDYYCKLDVRIEPMQGGGTRITLMPVDLAIYTDYVYNADGRVLTLSKNYPYSQYPSMFDLQEVNRALQRVMSMLRKNLG